MSDKQTPCGNCSSGGIYAFEAVVEGVQTFGGCQDRIGALRLAPRCKHRPLQICMGARDFIVSCEFPISDAMKSEYAPHPPANRDASEPIENKGGSQS